jgi:CheY-like chemotaxis protein
MSASVVTQTPNPSPQAHAATLLASATDYALSAFKNVIQKASGDPLALQDLNNQYVDLVFGFEIDFLFPNLSNTEKQLLLAALKYRNALNVQFSGIPQWRTAEQKAEHDQITQSSKTDFAKTCQHIRNSDLPSKLNPVQQEVLQHEFLSVILDREEDTRFCFLPSRTTNPQPEPDPEPAPPAQTTVAQKKILVINRNPHETQSVLSWLKDAGYNAISITPGFAGCRQALAEKPDLIFLEFTTNTLDWPGDRLMDGETTFRVLSRIPKSQGIPVIGLAEEDSTAIHHQALNVGATACITKPLSREKLLTTLQPILPPA